MSLRSNCLKLLQRIAAPYREILHRPFHTSCSQQIHPATRERSICLNVIKHKYSKQSRERNNTLCWRHWTRIAGTRVGSVGTPKLILNPADSRAMLVPRLMTTHVDSAALGTFCCYGYAAYGMEADHFQPNLHLKHLCTSGCHTDVA